MSMNRSMGTVILITVVLVMETFAQKAASADDAQGQGPETVNNGVVHVMNPALPTDGVHTITTRKVWKVGEEDTGDTVFGDIIAVVRDHAGNSYLLDAQQAQVYAISPEGEFLGTRGGPGEGPSEFGAASALAILADTLLCVTQSMPPRLVLMDLRGQAEGDHPLSQELDTTMIYGSAPAKDGMALFLGEFVQKEHSIGLNSSIRFVNAKGVAAPACWEMFQEADVGAIQFDEKTDGPPVWAVNRDGRVFVSEDWDAYEIESIDVDGGNRMVFRRAYTPITRAQWQLTLVGKHMDKKEMSPDTKLSEFGRTIVRIFPRDNGTVWVLNDQGENGVVQDVLVQFDVFDRKGHFLRQAKVLGIYQPGRDRLFLVDDYLYVVVNGGELGGDPIFTDDVASDAMEVRCLALGATPSTE